MPKKGKDKFKSTETLEKDLEETLKEQYGTDTIEKMKKHNLDIEFWAPHFKDKQLESLKEKLCFFETAIKANRKDDCDRLGSLLCPDLAKSLEDKYALDPSHWVYIFLTLGITNSQQLQYVDQDMFTILNQQKNHKWEEKALAKLCKFKDIDDQELEALHKDVTGLLQKEGERFKDYTERRKALDDSALKLEYQLNEQDVMTRLQKGPGGTDLIQRQEIDDRTLIKSISAGQVLRGIYFHKNLQASAIYRHRLIKLTPSDLKLSSCENSQQLKDYIIYDENKSLEFETTLKKFGVTAAAKFKINMPTYHIRAGGSGGHENRSEEQKSKRNEKNFVKIIQLYVVPTASFSLSDARVELSDGARKALAKLEPSSINFSDDCVHFFNTYGSHYFNGVYHFGGTYEWTVKSTTESSGDAKQNIEAAKQGLGGSFSLGLKWFSIGAGADGERTNDSLKKTESSMDKYEIEKTLTKTGGPQEVDDVNLWKKGLVQFRNTWQIIDRDTSFKSYVGIWELMEQEKFPSDLCYKVKGVWENIYKQDVDDSMAWSKDQLGIEEHSFVKVGTKGKSSENFKYSKSWGK